MRTDGQTTHKIFPTDVIEKLKITFPEISVVGVIVWESIIEPGRPQMAT
jgi:hypothetical protein